MFKSIERVVSELAFEPANTGFYYYPDNSSAGIPVSAAEKALYVDGPRHQFFQAINGRVGTGPRRNRLRTFIRFQAGLPAQVIGLNAVNCLILLSASLRAEPGLLRNAFSGMAVFLGMMIVVAVLAKRQMPRSTAPPVRQ